MKRIFLFLALLIFANAGAQWITYTLPYNGFAYRIEFFGLNTGIICGHTFDPFNGKIFYTTNSGVNWNAASYPPEIRVITRIQFITSTLVYACGAENYTAEYSKKVRSDFLNYPYSLRQKLINEGRTELSSGYKAAFIKSTNAGVTWTKVGTFDTLSGYMNDIKFFDANTGYALIDSGSNGYTRFFKTTNGGSAWQFVSDFSDLTPNKDKLVFTDNNTGYVSGFSNGGKIYKTTNAGLNWTAKTLSSQVDAMAFFDANTGVYIGVFENGVNGVYKTTNGGAQWNQIVSNQLYRQYNEMKILPATGTAFAVGYYQYDTVLTKFKASSLKTTNYGNTWVLSDFSPDIMGTGVCLIDQNNFYISGGDYNFPATIMKSTNGGNVFVSQTGTELPSLFKLHQNFPNPFNPSTKITFDISKAGFVRISVFNTLGREVSVLINENLIPGSYTTAWDASSFSSGIYFCKMESGNFTETRKMLLLK